MQQVFHLVWVIPPIEEFAFRAEIVYVFEVVGYDRAYRKVLAIKSIVFGKYSAACRCRVAFQNRPERDSVAPGAVGNAGDIDESWHQIHRADWTLNDPRPHAAREADNQWN